MVKESLRKCVGCGEIKSRNEMIKITRDFSTNQNFIEQALKKKKINRVLKINTALDLKGYLDGQLKG